VECFKSEFFCFIVDIGGVERAEGEPSVLAVEGCLDGAEHGVHGVE
jgi:hypothetical protein